MSTKKQNTKAKTTSKKKSQKDEGVSSFKELFRSKEGLTEDQKDNRKFAIGIILILIAVGVTLSMVSHIFTGAADQAVATNPDAKATNWLGTVGYHIAHEMMDKLFGLPTIIVPIFVIACCLRMMGIVKIRIHKWFINCMLLMLWFSTAIAFVMNTFEISSFMKWGGAVGEGQVFFLENKIGPIGTFLTLLGTAILYIGYISERALTAMRHNTIDRANNYIEKKQAEREERKRNEENAEDEENIDFIPEDNERGEEGETEVLELFGDPTETEEKSHQPFVDDAESTATVIDFAHEPLTGKPTTLKEGEQELPLVFEPPTEEMSVTIGKDPEKADIQEGESLEPYDPKLDLEFYKYPPVNLLKKYDLPASAVDWEEQQANKNQIISVLRTFGVEISDIKATVGPTITLYEITPAPGVRIRKIQNLENDIALSLRALGIRIIAPIPGKGTIGIEVPNAKPQMVSMESIINTRKFQETDFELPMALGKTITNEVFMVDLAKMPHLLVAGATGQGKSVGLNAILTSLLYKKHPAELKIVMVDPKKVEFSVYNPIVNHFLAQVEGNEGEEEPIITDVKKVVQTLNSLCVEMDTRYDLLKQARARNVKEYNQKFRERQLNPLNGHKFMPYIVVVIDEFGDLIMTAGKEVELPIARIAQLARAVGIHMIIATQRPTTNIITGTIKANFPARMAFKVSAMIDSRTILDRPGANQLVGRGDMLFLAGSEPVRVQCAFVDTPEVEAITNFIADQQGYTAPFPLPEVPMDEEEGSSNDVDMTRLDALFEDCARMIVAEQVGSTSMIQRKFSIGFNRAGRIMDQIEKAGIVGPARGARQREVLVQSMEQLDMILASFR